MADQVDRIVSVRQATAGEVPALVALVDAYGREVLPGDMPPDPRTVTRTLTRLIAAPSGAVFVLGGAQGPRGILAATLSPSPCWSVVVAEMLILFLLPAARGGRNALRLIEAFEGWAQDQGARVLGVADTGGDLGRLLKNRGYRHAETKFLRAV